MKNEWKAILKNLDKNQKIQNAYKKTYDYLDKQYDEVVLWSNYIEVSGEEADETVYITAVNFIKKELNIDSKKENFIDKAKGFYNSGEALEYTEEQQNEDLEFYKNNTKKEGMKRLGKNILETKVKSYQPKNLVHSYLGHFQTMAALFIAPIGFIWSLISFFKNKNVDDGYARNKLRRAKINLGISSFIMIGTILFLFSLVM